MTEHHDLFAALAAPFEPTEVKVRTQGNKQLHYVTARTVMNRLDNVLGPENWWDEFLPSEHSVLCRLTIRLPDGSILTKADAGGYAGMADSGDDDKSGYSDAFKRAGVKFGIGRYLYRDGVPTFAEAPVQAQIPARPRPPTQARKVPAPAPAPEAIPAASASTSTVELPEAWGQKKSLATDFLSWLEKSDPSRRGLYRVVLDAARAAKMPVRVLGWDRDQITRAYRFAVAQLEAKAHTQNGTAAHAG